MADIKILDRGLEILVLPETERGEQTFKKLKKKGWDTVNYFEWHHYKLLPFPGEFEALIDEAKQTVAFSKEFVEVLERAFENYTEPEPHPADEYPGDCFWWQASPSGGFDGYDDFLKQLSRFKVEVEEVDDSGIYQRKG